MSGLSSGSYTLLGIPGFPTSASIDDGATVALTLAGLQGEFVITGNANSITTITQSAAASDTLYLSCAGGQLSLDSTISDNSDIVTASISGGGSLIVGNAFATQNNGSTVDYGAGGGTLVIGSSGGATTLGLTISDFTSSSDLIDAAGLSFGGITGYTISVSVDGAQTISVSDSSGAFSFDSMGTDYTAQVYANGSGPLGFANDGSGGTDISACFLRGTRIAVQDGLIAVEELRVGDLIATQHGCGRELMPVSWIGHRTVQVSDFSDPSAAWPVRICADAFSSGTPTRDLLVTPDHCIFIDGALIPARMLVNGGSIAFESSFEQYQYFHVELATHRIIFAEGLPTESYLDTGNRGIFANASLAWLRADFSLAGRKSWSRDAAAPLATERAIVEPIWQRLADRSRISGFAQAPALRSSTNDPQLCLLTQSGQGIRPISSYGGVYSFAIPPEARCLHLLSLSGRPSETVGPFLDDRRRLGVRIGRIRCGIGSIRKECTAHLQAHTLRGWHGIEAGEPGRWTTGAALLPLDLEIYDGRRIFVDIEVLDAGPYLISADQNEQASARHEPESRAA